jgi:hypothetical protein
MKLINWLMSDKDGWPTVFIIVAVFAFLYWAAH